MAKSPSHAGVAARVRSRFRGNAERVRWGRIEDAVFGLRAAGPALMSKVSYFERRMVSWDPIDMLML